MADIGGNKCLLLSPFGASTAPVELEETSMGFYTEGQLLLLSHFLTRFLSRTLPSISSRVVPKEPTPRLGRSLENSGIFSAPPPPRQIILEHLDPLTAENSVSKWALQLWLVAERLLFAEQVPG